MSASLFEISNAVHLQLIPDKEETKRFQQVYFNRRKRGEKETKRKKERHVKQEERLQEIFKEQRSRRRMRNKINRN
jgi:hypothetical protein